MVSVDYLESERKKTWEKIIELQDLVKKKTSDYEDEAKQSSRKCSEYKNKCESSKDEANIFLESVKNVTDKIQESNVIVTINQIRSDYDELLPKIAQITANIDSLEVLFADYPTYVERVNKIDEIAETADEHLTKIDTLFNQLVVRKKEFDQIYFEVIGYKTTDPASGEVTTVKGRKDELENAYTLLKEDLDTLLGRKTKEFDDAIIGWSVEYKSVLGKIESLLPNALTAGLSHAYSDKKKDEINESAALAKVFKKYVNGLIVISCIPFGISVYLLLKGVSLDETILKIPRLVLSILPLYIPVLWVAYSANRKMNLSKRLIEEYTHKEVCSGQVFSDTSISSFVAISIS